MASSHHVEMEAAKFLQKLIQESKDEPSKLATKLYVILQHMKSSGKEQSLPYQVISRAMETVICQHGLDINVLKSSRLTLASGTPIGESSGHVRPKESDAAENPAPVGPAGSVDVSLKTAPATSRHMASGKPREEVYGGLSQGTGAMKENEMARHAIFNSSKPPIGPSRADSTGHDVVLQSSTSQRNSQSFEHDSPASVAMEDSKSVNSLERHNDTVKLDKQESLEPSKDSRKASVKRNRPDSVVPVKEGYNKNARQVDTLSNTTLSSKKGKLEKVSSLSGGTESIFRINQENPQTSSMHEKSTPKSKVANAICRAPSSKYPEEGEVSSVHGVFGLHQGGSIQSGFEGPNSRGLCNQTKMGLPLENPQITEGRNPETPSGKQLSENTKDMSNSEKNLEVHSSLSSGKVLMQDIGLSHPVANTYKMVQGSGTQAGQNETCGESSGNKGMGKSSPVPQCTALSDLPFKEHHLKQLRAQCLVFLAFRCYWTRDWCIRSVPQATCNCVYPA